MLLGMTRDELKVVCPEEGGRVYYQLQNVKSALAVSSQHYSQTHIYIHFTLIFTEMCSGKIKLFLYFIL